MALQAGLRRMNAREKSRPRADCDTESKSQKQTHKEIPLRFGCDWSSTTATGEAQSASYCEGLANAGANLLSLSRIETTRSGYRNPSSELREPSVNPRKGGLGRATIENADGNVLRAFGPFPSRNETGPKAVGEPHEPHLPAERENRSSGVVPIHTSRNEAIVSGALPAAEPLAGSTDSGRTQIASV